MGRPRFVEFGGEFGREREREGRGERVKSGWLLVSVDPARESIRMATAMVMTTG